MLALPAGSQPAIPTWEGALDLYEHGDLVGAAQQFQRLAEASDDVEVRGQALNNACVLLNDLGDFQQSIPSCLEAERIIREAGPSQELPRVLNNLAVARQGNGDVQGAIEALQEARKLNWAAQDFDGTAANLTNLGINEQSEGRLARADDYFSEAIGLCAAHDAEPWSAPRRAVAELNRAGLMERLGRYDEALTLLERLLERHANAGDLPGPLIATADLDRGVIYRNLGDPHAALESFELAHSQYQAMGSVGGGASVLLNSALVYQKNLGKPDRALPLLEEALGQARAIGEPGLEVEILFTLGQVQLALSDPESARTSFRSAHDLAEASDSGIALWSSLAGLAAVDRAQGDLAGAQARLDDALGVIADQARGLSAEVRSTFLSERRPIYEAAIALRLTSGFGDDETLAWETFTLAQAFKDRAIAEALGQPTPQSNIVSPEAVYESLGKSVLLDYFETEGRLMTWVIDPNIRASTVVDLGPAETLRPLVTELLERTRSGGPPSTHSRTLGRTLIEQPLREAGLNEIPGQLILSPDFFLWSLPFDLLEVSASAGTVAKLLDRSSLRMVPSAYALVRTTQRPSPEFSLKFEGWALDEATTAAQHVPFLAHSAAEISEAARVLGGLSRLFIGEDASEQRLRRSPSSAQVRHFATHAVVDDRAGIASTLILAADGESIDDDGRLSPSEIARLDLVSELTVLAACSTLGHIEESSNPALATLGGAFLSAGSRAVLATVWDIDDESSQALLAQFYHRLSRGDSAAEALQSAKQALASDKRWSDPRRWAGWVLIGENPSLVPRWRADRWLLVLGLVALLLLALFGVRRRRVEADRAPARVVRPDTK